VLMGCRVHDGIALVDGLPHIETDVILIANTVVTCAVVSSFVVSFIVRSDMRSTDYSYCGMLSSCMVASTCGSRISPSEFWGNAARRKSFLSCIFLIRSLVWQCPNSVATM